MPPQPKTTKRSASAYGEYAMPHLRRQTTEEPLEAPPSSPQGTTSSPPKGPLGYHLSASNSSNSSYHPLPHGILPVCHPTLESAIQATNNCSSHGDVYLKSSQAAGEDKSGGGNLKISCWACKCRKTVITDSKGGTKTVAWGGPACQKKDVAFQFWLLAGMTVGLVAVVSWGIGLLVSIGQEDLPSVIGAGVAGPWASK